MSKKKIKKMHIKKWKYNHRPKERKISALVYFLNHMDESVRTLTDFVSYVVKKIEEFSKKKDKK